jgi:hypothetical protein
MKEYTLVNKSLEMSDNASEKEHGQYDNHQNRNEIADRDSYSSSNSVDSTHHGQFSHNGKQRNPSDDNDSEFEIPSTTCKSAVQTRKRYGRRRRTKIHQKPDFINTEDSLDELEYDLPSPHSQNFNNKLGKFPNKNNSSKARN